MSNKQTIWVDLDGVLVAFYEFVELYLDLERDHHPNNGKLLYPFMEVATEEFRMFRILPRKKDFNMAIKFLGELRQIGHEVEILGSIGNSKNRFLMQEDKHLWLDKTLKGTQLEGIKRNFVEGSSQKSKFCNKGDILIDDYSKPGKMWQEAGGYWVHHINWNTSIPQIQAILK